jgi:PTH1 family peptidyl-tRNA hydrolase
VKLIVGLGNPGPDYARTRHNVGFRVVDLLGQRFGVDLGSRKFAGYFGKGTIRGESVALLKPLTFMNRSGQAVLEARQFYRLENADLLVISDDVALELGRLRIRKAGSAGGHNGLSDIIARLGADDFPRLRMGIGRPPGNQVSYVLGPFAPDEEPVVEQMVARAADAAECWAVEGADAAMNKFNLGPAA